MVPWGKGGSGEVVIKSQDQTEKWQQQCVANWVQKVMKTEMECFYKFPNRKREGNLCTLGNRSKVGNYFILWQKFESDFLKVHGQEKVKFVKGVSLSWFWTHCTFSVIICQIKTYIKNWFNKIPGKRQNI